MSTSIELTLQRLPAKQLPMSLLTEADPEPERVALYHEQGEGFGASVGGELVGGAICVQRAAGRYELMNISVYPKWQKHGVGSRLLAFVIESLTEQGAGVLELGTGTFGYQLAFYQRQGFRVEAVLKNHFLDNYPEPIFEEGIQHQDMLWLSMKL
ncbi:GNAT family N-acetyltransferase [Aliagarivorans marinus]|uniref:GNAT family N-acetyltransferase n=1 Tax=Aliagarivorans marinus TaxID=561965 RepID=UPI0004161DBD|nr:GNAT family N-acetyltransferase [Aliagarivorans marinus]